MKIKFWNFLRSSEDTLFSGREREANDFRVCKWSGLRNELRTNLIKVTGYSRFGQQPADERVDGETHLVLALKHMYSIWNFSK